MKKFILVAVALIAGIAAAYAQPRAIGGRLGYGLEFSYQHGLGESNMVSFEAGFPGFWGVEAAATYDWIFPISSWQHKGEWNWYAGVGGGFNWSWFGWFGVGVAGRIGVEYDFWFPLQLSLDWRPVIGPEFDYYDGGIHTGFGYSGLYAGAIALGVRYKF